MQNNKDGEIRVKLIEYKELTLNLIKALEDEEYDLLSTLLDDRQKIIDSASLIRFSKEDFSSICSELQILQTQKRLNDLMNYKRGILRDEMDKIAFVKNANRSYTKKNQVDSIFFNKKI